MNDTAYKNFTDLEVGKKARLLKNEIKDLTSCFPGEEKFRLTDQLIRSSRSITVTIAEGHGRFTYKDQNTLLHNRKRFCERNTKPYN